LSTPYHISSLILWVGVLSAILAQPAYAYLDPGSGSFLLQILLASLVGLLFVTKQFWGRIRAALQKAGKRLFHPAAREHEPPEDAG